MARLIVVLCLMGLWLVACEGNAAEDTSSGQQVGPLDWDRDPNNIILRVDESRNDDAATLANEIPPCTVWGDGRVVWINDLEDSRQVLEAQVSDETIRALIETVVFSGFYDWESDFTLPNTPNPAIRSITLNLFSEERTVSRYSEWPLDGYDRILEECRQLSEEPVLFLPQGAWVAAHPVQYDATAGLVPWYDEAAEFHLSEVAEGAPPRWISGNLVIVLWRDVIMPQTTFHVYDQEQSYQLVLQVPRIMRDAPPPPSE